MTKIHVLILDDNLESVTTPLEKALQPFLQPKQRIPEFERDKTQPLTLHLGEKRVECHFSHSIGKDAGAVTSQILDGTFKGRFDLVLLDSDWQNERHAGAQKLLPALLNRDSGITGPVDSTPFIALFTGYWGETWEQFWNRIVSIMRDRAEVSCKLDGLHKEDYGRLRLLFYTVIQSSLLLEKTQQIHQLKRWSQDQPIIGSSPQIKKLIQIIEKAAASEEIVLIQGESGTGKKLVAEAIHFTSKRRFGPLVTVECSGLPETLLESELFGHKKGAFTGASSDRKGLFEEAAQGTVFLDEVQLMSPLLQGRLLRVLQEKEVRPVGANTYVRVDVRVVVATNEDLEEKVRAGDFRQDLYYRLAVIPINVPALRDRREDIPLLVKHFLAGKLHSKTSKPFSLTSGALERLQNRDWPGNVRELENLVERMVALSDDDLLDVDDIPPEGRLAHHERGSREAPIVSPNPTVAAAGHKQSEIEAVREKLNEYETACMACAISGAKPSTFTEIAKYLGLTSHATVSYFFSAKKNSLGIEGDERARIIRFLFNTNPQSWPCLRSITAISKMLG